MEKIRCIIEAFSMRPEILQVVESNEKYFDKPRALKEIKLEYLEGVYDKEMTAYYVGYNFEGKKLFQYLAKSVNVHYQI